MRACPQLPLRVGDLIIRPTLSADEAGVAQAGRDPDIRRMPWFGAAFVDAWAKPWIERAEAEWRAGRHFVFSILAADETYLGAVVISAPSAEAVEVSYWVLPEARNRGVASRAVGAVLTWARPAFPKARIWAKTAADNVRSQMVLRKYGFEETERAEVVVFTWRGG
jgi:RimJ/RimL family protein N-acetyltransferase